MSSLYVIFKHNTNEIEPLFCVYDDATNPSAGICSYLKSLNDTFDYSALSIGNVSYRDSFTYGHYSKKDESETKNIRLLVKVDSNNVPIKVVKTNQDGEVSSYARLLNEERTDTSFSYEVFSVRGEWST